MSGTSRGYLTAAFLTHVSLMSLNEEQAINAEDFLSAAFALPPIVSIVLVTLAASKMHVISWTSARAFLKQHILLTQPALAIFLGSVCASLTSIQLEGAMQNEEIVMMSIFALIVFLICAWFLPFALKPMLRLHGRSEQATGMLANLIGLLLALMMAIVAFKAREKFGGMNAAFNTLIDGVIAFLVAALAGAGALLAAGKIKSGHKSNDNESTH